MTETTTALMLAVLALAVTVAGAMGPRRPGPCFGKRCGD